MKNTKNGAELLAKIVFSVLICIIVYLLSTCISLKKDVNNLEMLVSDLYSEHRAFVTDVTGLIEEIETDVSNIQKEMNDISMENRTSEEILDEAVVENEFNRPYSSEILKACSNYDFADDLPLLISAIMEVESNFQIDTLSSAGCVGLMQISPYWQRDRIDKLGIEDISDPYSNILVAVDFLEDLYYHYANCDIVLAVMMYNMDFVSAKKIYNSGQWSQYARDVFSIFDSLKGV